jgi:translation initiation factor 2 subunit 2
MANIFLNVKELRSPMTGYDYEALLKKAKAKLPQHVSSGERFQMPEPDLFIEGKTTVFRNFGDIAEAFRREPEAIFGYLLRELGTAGYIDGRRAIFKSRLGHDQVGSRLKAYLATFVLCSECGRPDTILVKDGRVLVLQCEACGAHRPVNVPRGATVQEAALEVGKTYELIIQDLGKKGDGIARVDKYIIFVPGTTKGSVAKVRIENISGTTAFGQVVVE